MHDWSGMLGFYKPYARQSSMGKLRPCKKSPVLPQVGRLHGLPEGYQRYQPWFLLGTSPPGNREENISF